MSERTIWKCTIPVNVLSASFTTVHKIPAQARLLHVREQRDSVALWFEIPDPKAAKRRRSFQIFGTGTGPIRDGLRYVGTGIFADGDLVLHVYEVEDEPT